MIRRNKPEKNGTVTESRNWEEIKKWRMKGGKV
jgi:hypothetical protein